MPTGILIISNSFMLFTSSRQLERLIAAYFKYILGDFYIDDVPVKSKPDVTEKRTIYTREPEPPTVSGLAYHLGFATRRDFDEYETNGEFASLLRRSRLRIEAEYEKKLHQQASGAIFALKNIGWLDSNEASGNTQNLEIKIVDNGPVPASAESEVNLS